MIEVFLKDIFDKKTIIKSLITTIVMVFLAGLLLNEISKNQITLLQFIIVISLTSSVYYFLDTYLKKDRILFYYSLPYANQEVNIALFVALLLDTILRKILPVILLLIYLRFPINNYILLISFTPLMILFCMVLFLNDNSYQRILMFIACYLISIVTIFFNDIMFSVIVNVLIILIFSYFLFSKHATYLETKTIKSARYYHSANYFLKVMFSEKSYIINLITIIIFTFILSLNKEYIVFRPVLFAIVVINTPIMTIFSTEPDLKNYDEMLPHSRTSLSKSYRYFLFIYFLLMNIYVSVLWPSGNVLEDIIICVILSFIEMLVATSLEQYFPLKNKKTTIEVWRSPRKYLLPCLVFLLVFMWTILRHYQ